MSDSHDQTEFPIYSTEEVETAAALFARHYDELLQIARKKRRRSRSGDSLLTIDLVHSSFVRLTHGKWKDDGHFLAAVTLAIRHTIIDHARKKLSQLRSDGALETFDEQSALLPEFNETPEDVLMIADLLDTMAATKPQWQRIVDARYFFGLTEDETATALGISVRTVRREWKAARLWLSTHLLPNQDNSDGG